MKRTFRDFFSAKLRFPDTRFLTFAYGSAQENASRSQDLHARLDAGIALLHAGSENFLR